MRSTFVFIFLFLVTVLAGCVSSDGENVLASATQQPSLTQQPAAAGPTAPSGAVSPQPVETAQTPGLSYGNNAASQQRSAQNGVFAAGQDSVVQTFRPRNKKTHLINGLASSVESIGYGFTNLAKKIPGSSLHNYASFVESSTIIRSRITRELKQAYKRDPNVEINLIGISFGANIATLIAADLDRAGIPVHYLATMEGPAMVPINRNVKSADNFSCTNLDCFRTKSRLAWGNKKTRFATFKIKSSHIPLANHPDVHRRIIAQINRPREPLIATQ